MTMPPEHDPHDLQRFVSAQQGIYERALAEIEGGSKVTHWMWFIFPQVEGLAHSSTAIRYAIRSVEEAGAYLAHPALGPRLEACFSALLGVEGKSAERIFGAVDAAKLRSSATLFAAVSGRGDVYEQALNRYFDGERDPRTLAWLDARRGQGASFT